MSRPLIPGLTGELVSQAYAATLLQEAIREAAADHRARRARRTLAEWWRQQGRHLGPASSLRQIVDTSVSPLFDLLGYDASWQPFGCGAEIAIGRAVSPVQTSGLVASLWGHDLSGVFVRAAAAHKRTGSLWQLGCDGRVIRLWDLRRGWARTFVQFDMTAVAADNETFVLWWYLLRAECLVSRTAAAIDTSLRHGAAVRLALRAGVREAVQWLAPELVRRRTGRSEPVHLDAGRDAALTVVYQLLFLLFADARGLLPSWHPRFRAAYALETLRARAEDPDKHDGTWAHVLALCRMARAGCRAGDFVFPPFNGRLFSDRTTPTIEAAAVNDSSAARAILALTTRRTPNGLERVAFGDLGVEQLGAIYESVLGDDVIWLPSGIGRPPDSCPKPHVTLVNSGIRRKTSGTFYTPREVADYLVRRTLAPLVAGRSAEDILALRILDPAMGSGAFLVAACQYLAGAYEHALIRERGVFAGDISESDRAGFRRLIAQRCLYGVDINPMAVQIARLSLWLATLAAGKPLTFLDHRLMCGNSLVGATIDDIGLRPTVGRRHRQSPTLPLFGPDTFEPWLRRALPLRRTLAERPDDRVGDVREKSRLVASLRGGTAGQDEWRRLADTWCAYWFWPSDQAPVPPPQSFADLAATIRGTSAALPAHSTMPLLETAARVAREAAFFHWTIEFPEVFYDEAGTPRTDGGFDAIVTNPPWEVGRGDLGTREQREHDRQNAVRLNAFVHRSGGNNSGLTGHINLYQVFTERCLGLLRAGGRIGLIVPWGLASDRGSARLRSHILDRCTIDTFVGLENTRAIFPVHRSLRLLLLTACTGPQTTAIVMRLGITDVASLSHHPESVTPAPDDQTAVVVPVAALPILAGPERACPYVKTRRDFELLTRLLDLHPTLGGSDGWALSFGRELNASDDRHILASHGPGLPVIEGKQIIAYGLRAPWSGRWFPAANNAARPLITRAASVPRLAYRDVAASTNRRTLIAAILPRGYLSVHTVQCLRNDVPLDDQQYLCGILNSFVADFVVRLWVTTHVGTTIGERLPVPRAATSTRRVISRLAGWLAHEGAGWAHIESRIQGLAARLFGLNRRDYMAVLEGFPLVDGKHRQRCLAWFDAGDAAWSAALTADMGFQHSMEARHDGSWYPTSQSPPDHGSGQ